MSLLACTLALSAAVSAALILIMAIRNIRSGADEDDGDDQACTLGYYLDWDEAARRSKPHETRR